MSKLSKHNRFVDQLFVAFKWRKLIIINFLIISFLAAGYSLIMPKTYQAKTVILPPLENYSGFGISNIMEGTLFSGIGLGGMSEGIAQFLAILHSRSIMESVVHEFGLIQRYGAEDLEDAVRDLREHTRVELIDDGTIAVLVSASTKYFSNKQMENETRSIASRMANYFIQELDRINTTLKVNSAKSARIFIEKRYLKTTEDLEKAENRLNEFQKRHGIITINDQVKATISLLSELKANKVVKEISLEALYKNFGENHSEIFRIKHEIEAINNKISSISKGTGDRFSSDAMDDQMFFSMDSIPDLSLQYARLYRDVLLQEKIIEFILPQYEQAKIQEAKDTPTVQILDKAVPPVKRIKPKRAFFVLAWGFLALVISFLGIHTYEAVNQLRANEGETSKKINAMLNMLRRKS